MEEDSNLNLEISLSVDRDGFFRHTCPFCGRDFKTDVEKKDLGSVITPQFRRLGVEIGEAPVQEEKRESDYRFCPYCSEKADVQDTLTEEITDYIHWLVQREIVMPSLDNVFSGVFGSGRSSRESGVSLKYERALLPPRPIHGPEPPDMKIVEFLCCQRKAKISEGWNMLEQCVYCGKPITLR